MNDLAIGFLPQLARATLALSLCSLTSAALLRMARVTSPTMHRAACLAALAAGWFLMQLPVEVPWYEPEPTEAALAYAEPEPPEVDSLLAELPPIPLSELQSTFAAPPMTAPQPEAISAAPLPPAAAPAWRPAWQLLVCIVWLGGAVALALYWIASYARFVWRLPRGRSIGPAWDEPSQLVATGLQAVPLRVTAGLGPLLCRLPWGYEIVVPEPLWRELTAGERAAVLRHELAHLRRGDVWKSLAAHLLALAHWFNPIAWWTVRRFDEAAEWACDRAAATERASYARILVRLGELANSPVRLGSAMSRRPLAARIRRLVTLPQPEDSVMKRSLAIAVILCLVAAAAVRVQLVAREPVVEEELAPPAPQEEPVPARDVPALEEPSDVPSVAEAPATAEQPAAESAVDAPASVEAPSPVDESPRVDAVTTLRVENNHQKAIRVAKEKMALSARRAYEAMQAAYESGTVTQDMVTFWSDRWLAAELAVARNRGEQLAAAKAHLKRMQQFQEKIAALYRTGSRGGEANTMAAADYFVAEAERKLAEIEAANKPVAVLRTIMETVQLPDGKTIQRPRTVTEYVVPAPAQAMVPPTVSTEPVILRQAPAPSEVPQPATAPLGPPPVSRPTLAPAAAPSAVPDDVPIAAPVPAAAPRAVPASAAPTPAPAVPRPSAAPSEVPQPAAAPERPRPASRPAEASRATPGDPTPARGRRERVYKDRTFDQWREQFEVELDFESRIEALAALRQFAANGQGKDVAEAAVEGMGGYSIEEWTERGGPDSEKVAELFEAARLAVASGPTGDVVPVLSRYIKEGTPNEKIFAMYALPAKGKRVPPALLVEAMHDEDEHVRETALVKACEIDYHGATAALETGFGSSDRDEKRWAAELASHLVEANADSSTLGSVARKLAQLLGDKDAELRDTAFRSLKKLGSLAVPALKEIEASGDRDAALRATELLRFTPAPTESKPR